MAKLATLKFSKAVHPGDLVTRRGDKYIRCGRRGCPVGVYQSANELLILHAGGLEKYQTPAGIVMRGRTTVSTR